VLAAQLVTRGGVLGDIGSNGVTAPMSPIPAVVPPAAPTRK